MDPYAGFAAVYDELSSHMTEDVDFYVELACEADGPVVELAVGSGRVAIPTARATGRRVIGIDVSPTMLAVARERAGAAGVDLDLREGDMRELALDEPAALVTCPFRALLHLPTWADRRRVFERVAASLRPGGRFVWNAFVFDPKLAASLDGQWHEQGGVRHRVDYIPTDNRLALTLEGGDSTTLWWVARSEWEALLDVSGLETEALYGWFDRRPFDDQSPEFVWVARKPDMSLYDPIAGIYDPWSRSVIEDVEFYVDEALASGGPVVELAVGTGRVAVPIAVAGIHVIGVDLSERMLDVARGYARERGVESLVDLRHGDLRDPPVSERVPLAICPFRSLLHMAGPDEKLAALRAAHAVLEPGGRFVFDVFAPTREDIDETHGRWLEREPGIFERADWDELERTLTLSVRRGEVAASFALHWQSDTEWRDLVGAAGFEVAALWGWFDHRPYEGGEDMVFSCRRPA